MSGEADRREASRNWIAKAEHDLRNASHTLTLGRLCPTDTVCFHAQQCVEKYVKATLVWKGIEVPRIHDIAALLRALPRSLRPDLLPTDQEDLTRAATQGRYPGSQDPTLAEARHAVKVARTVRRTLRWRLALVLEKGRNKKAHR